MMRYGIPAYRLPRDVLDAEIARIAALGVSFEQDHRVVDLARERDGFDAVFVAVGAHLSKRVDIPDADAGRVLDAVTFLREAAGGRAPVEGRVAVYGGGNTAMDAARVARRLGADDTVIVYRRSRAQMPAHEEEAADAEAEGVRINWLRTITGMHGYELTVEVQELDENGRPHGTGRFETLAADTVVLALGQESDTSFLRGVDGRRVRRGRRPRRSGHPDDRSAPASSPVATPCRASGPSRSASGTAGGPHAASTPTCSGMPFTPAHAAPAGQPGPAQPLVLRRPPPARAAGSRPGRAHAGLRRGRRRAVARRGAVRGGPVPVVRQLLRVRRLLRRLPRGRDHQARQGRPLPDRPRPVHRLRRVLPPVPRARHRARRRESRPATESRS